MSNYEERFMVNKAPTRQEVLAFRLEAVAKEIKTIPLCHSYEQAMSMQATIEFIARLDAIRHG